MYFVRLKMDKIWLEETENGVEELHINLQDIKKRSQQKKKLENSTGFQEKPKKKTCVKLTEKKRSSGKIKPDRESKKRRENS